MTTSIVGEVKQLSTRIRVTIMVGLISFKRLQEQKPILRSPKDFQNLGDFGLWTLDFLTRVI